MAVANGNSSNRTKTYNCYSVPGLISPILETSQSSRIDDHYILGNQLGWGQFGVIRVCSNLLNGEHLACKSIPKSRLLTSEDVRNIKLEIEIMSKLSGHPNVVELKAVYEEENYIHLIMELCAGGELFHRLEKDGHFSEPNARALFRQLMEVVVYCHDNGIVHRDLKPENILLSLKSASSPIKLADFGLATYIKPGQLLTGTVGSPFYIAPEVLSGGYTQAADVWSAGVILYILLSGMPPFWGKTKSRIFDAVRSTDLKFPSEPWDSISTSAKELIVGMLCRDPKKRLTASQVLEHSWFTYYAEQQPSSLIQEKLGNYVGTGHSLSTPLNQTFSFQFCSPAGDNVALDYDAPAFSCKSSFSSFLMDPPPCTLQVGCDDSHSIEFSSPIQSMPSFAFFMSSSPKQCNSEAEKKWRESSFVKLFVDDPGLNSHSTKFDQNIPEIKKMGTTTTASSRASSIHGKRNQTMVLGEHKQLDTIVAESIIRWVSCHLPCATPLRSSLVF